MLIFFYEYTVYNILYVHLKVDCGIRRSIDVLLRLHQIGQPTEQRLSEAAQ